MKETISLKNTLPKTGQEALEAVFKDSSVGEFVEWGHRKFNVRFDRASISRQQRGIQSVSIPWQAVYVQFIIDRSIYNKN